MKDLYIKKDGEEKLVALDVQLLNLGEIAEKQFGQSAPIASQQSYLLFTKESLNVEAGSKYYILDGNKKMWVEPLEWMSHKSVDYPDNGFSIKILKSVNQPAD